MPRDNRPEWLSKEGVVMAGSWESFPFRVRRDGSPGYTPTAEQRAGYVREHSPEMVARLKDLGVNFVMMHCYKGGGLKAERESMADAVEFAKLALRPTIGINQWRAFDRDHERLNALPATMAEQIVGQPRSVR